MDQVHRSQIQGTAVLLGVIAFALLMALVSH
jgi:hypothetical protein